VAEIARQAEAFGFDALWSTELIHDPFLPGPLVSEHTQRLHYGTGVAIAFARSPANLAYMAWDLAQASRGRFLLGLGTQVKPHVERRFGMPWPASVVGKLREQVAALRTYWNAWQTGAKFEFRGEYYRLTLMTPFFNPGRIECPDIPVYLAGVNTGLARLAGEIAQGFQVHPFHTPRYLREVLQPAIDEGLQRSGRASGECINSASAFVVTSPEEDLFVRSQIGFYGSTPSYRAVMELHGWGEIAERLSELAREGRWGELPAQVTDEMLNEFAVVMEHGASGAELGQRLQERYAGLAGRLGIYAPFIPGQRDDFWRELVEQMKAS
jgi:probable F420-dependent oxidoreductase